jgi:hypothetical protein
MAQKEESLVLSDAVLLQMTRNTQVIAEFPVFGQLRQRTAKKPGCGKCGTKNRNVGIELDALRNSIVAMPLAQKARLKELMKAKQLVLKYRRGDNKLVKLLF